MAGDWAAVASSSDGSLLLAVRHMYNSPGQLSFKCRRGGKLVCRRFLWEELVLGGVLE